MPVCQRLAQVAVLSFVVFVVQISAATPQPLSVPPDQFWDGNDGTWSTFGMQIGTPVQNVRLLPATGIGSVWAVNPEGCTSSDHDPANCEDARGNFFLNNQSTTFVSKGIYDLSLLEEEILGYSGHGLYGWDTVTLGWQGDNLPTVQHQLVTGIATKDFYMGAFPLNPWNVNFTTLNDGSPSLLTNLKNQSRIPSLTWAYTAGMVNHDPPRLVYGSLTLGGYDASRFEDNLKLNFSMAADISRDLVVNIQKVTTNGTTLLSNPISAFIDSLVPGIWLPIDACQAFEKAFNLTYDTKSKLYLVGESLHQRLLATNPTVTFTIGPASTGDNVVIDMPYGSFDLNASFPLLTNSFINNSTRYFPLRRADNDTQYTLGRAFLQNAYVIANYEYYNFSVSRATYPSTTALQQLVALPAKGAKLRETKSGLSTGAIAGIAVGAAIITLLAVFLIYWFVVRKPKPAVEKPYEPVQQDPFGKIELDSTGQTVSEVEGTPYGRGNELEAPYRPEAKGDAVEMYAGEHGYSQVELPANEVAASEVQSPASTPFITPSSTPATTPGPQSGGYAPPPPGRQWSSRRPIQQ